MTKPITETKGIAQVKQALNQLDIPFTEYRHPAVFTVEEAEKHDRGQGVDSKNLFLRNKKGTQHYLVILEGSKRLDLKKLAGLVNESDVSFASPERLMKYLILTPGSVSPFGLLNNTESEVNVIIDNDLLRHEWQGFHPNDNTATFVISTTDFKKFLGSLKNRVDYLTL